MQVDDHGVDRVEYLRKRVDSQAANPHRTTFAVRPPQARAVLGRSP